MEIVLTRAALQRILEEAERAHPMEACGILLGRAGWVEHVLPARNVSPSPRTHFEIDPQALIDAQRAARQDGPDVLGYFHSHPTGPAEPSVTDAAQAAGDGRIWAIVAGGAVTFWHDDEDGFAKLSYIVSEG